MTPVDTLFGLDETELHALRERLFSATLDRIFAAHPFYRRRFATLGLARADLRGLVDLAKLPLTLKTDYMAAPAEFQLGREGAASDDEVAVWDVMYTTGSTSTPTPFVSTTYDFLNILAVNRNMMRIRRVTPDDSILNLFPLTRHPHGAFARAMHAAASVGIPVTAPLPGHASERRPEIGQRLDDVIATAVRVQPTILWGVPSYIHRMLVRARELGARLPRVRLVFVTGEGFGEGARHGMLGLLEAAGATDPRISVSYGATEMQGGMIECAHGSGYHNPAPDQFWFETVDPVTLAPLPAGELGLLLLTHLDRRGTVMLRYSLGDVARLERGRCPHCGALTERLTTVPQRVDGLVKIKGMLVNPAVLVDAVLPEPGVVAFQAVVDKEDPHDAGSMDVLRLKLVPADGADAELCRRLADRVRRAIGVTPVVDITTMADPLFGDRGWKAKPILDLRPAAS